MGALSHVTSKLNAKTVKSLLDRVTIGTTGSTDAHDAVVVEADEGIHKQVKETAVQAQAHSHVCKLACNRLDSCGTRRSHTQNCDGVDFPHKAQDLKTSPRVHAMREEGMAIPRGRK